MILWVDDALLAFVPSSLIPLINQVPMDSASNVRRAFEGESDAQLVKVTTGREQLIGEALSLSENAGKRRHTQFAPSTLPRGQNLSLPIQ